MTIRSVLIANRGEIAVRIIRAAKALGLRTVQVHSKADADSLAVKLADEAIDIGPAAAKKSYLNIEAILDRGQGRQGRRHPSGIRLPVRERRLRRGGRRGWHGFRRPRRSGDKAARRQGRGASGRRQGRRADRSWQRRPRFRSRRGESDRRAHRLSGHDQGGGRRRRQGHPHRRHHGGIRAPFSAGLRGSCRGVRRWRSVYREGDREGPAHRGPDPRRRHELRPLL